MAEGRVMRVFVLFVLLAVTPTSWAAPTSARIGGLFQRRAQKETTPAEGSLVEESEKAELENTLSAKYVPGVEAIVQWSIQAVTIMLTLYTDYAAGVRLKTIDGFTKKKSAEWDQLGAEMRTTLQDVQETAEATKLDAAKALAILNKIKLFPNVKYTSEGFLAWRKTKPEIKGDLDHRNVYLRELKAILTTLSAPQAVVEQVHNKIKLARTVKQQQALLAQVDEGDLQLEEYADVMEKLEEAGKEASVLAKSEETSDEKLAEVAKRTLADQTIGKLRPREIIKMVVQTATAYLLSLTKSVFASYVGVVWAAIDFIVAVRRHRAVMQRCEDLKEDYELMALDLASDVEYTACRGLTITVEFKRKPLSILLQLLNSAEHHLPKKAREELVAIVTGMKEQWDAKSELAKNKCLKFIMAPPPMYDAELINGKLGHRGILKVSKRLHWQLASYCFIPSGFAWLHCWRVEQGDVEILQADDHVDQAKTLKKLFAQPASLTVNLLLIKPVVPKKTAKSVELKYDATFRFNVQLESESARKMFEWTTLIAKIQAGAKGNGDYDSFYQLRDLAQAAPEQVFPNGDITQEPSLAFPAMKQGDSVRFLPVSTQYRDRLYSVITPEISPDPPGWANLVGNHVLLSRMHKMSHRNSLESVRVPAITSVIVVPHGKKEHIHLKDYTCEQDFAGPFQRQVYRFVCPVKKALPANLDWEHAVQTDAVAPDWVPHEMPVVGKQTKVNPYVNYRIAYSTSFGIPIAALGLCSRETMPTGWTRVPIFVETDKKTELECVATRLGSTETTKKVSLCMTKDKRIPAALLENAVNKAADEQADRIKRKALEVAQTAADAREEYDKWKVEEAARQREAAEKAEREAAEALKKQADKAKATALQKKQQEAQQAAEAAKRAEAAAQAAQKQDRSVGVAPKKQGKDQVKEEADDDDDGQERAVDKIIRLSSNLPFTITLTLKAYQALPGAIVSRYTYNVPARQKQCNRQRACTIGGAEEDPALDGASEDLPTRPIPDTHERSRTFQCPATKFRLDLHGQPDKTTPLLWPIGPAFTMTIDRPITITALQTGTNSWYDFLTVNDPLGHAVIRLDEQIAKSMTVDELDRLETLRGFEKEIDIVLPLEHGSKYPKRTYTSPFTLTVKTNIKCTAPLPAQRRRF